MSFKKKLTTTASRIGQLYREHPLEMTIVTIAAVNAAVKSAHVVNEGVNAQTYRREVARRERAQKHQFTI